MVKGDSGPGPAKTKTRPGEPDRVGKLKNALNSCVYAGPLGNRGRPERNPAVQTSQARV